MTILPEKFLLPEEDGLVMRDSQTYAIDKLKAVATYIKITTTAMRNKLWRGRYYIDLQAGPGKNKIGNEVLLGSPLIALTDEHGFTHYRFNDGNLANVDALRQRVKASPLHERAKIFQDDVNTVVSGICEEIEALDHDKNYIGKWSTLNLAFLDPEGLELHWNTVERLASINKMDLIINFSTSGLLRTIGKGEFEAGNRFFGTTEWQKVYKPTDNATTKRRLLIDFYRSRLQRFGYNVEIDPDLSGSPDIAFKNSRNSQVYSLIFASKNKLGDDFWKQAVKKAKPPKLPGFE